MTSFYKIFFFNLVLLNLFISSNNSDCNNHKNTTNSLKDTTNVSLPASNKSDVRFLKKDTKSLSDDLKQLTVTPEAFGAIGDGKLHKLNERYSSLDAAKKDFPGIKNLNITIDGAALQKAVNYISNKNGGVIIAEKNYVINYPIITQSNVTIDGKKKGRIFNDRSGNKYFEQWAFLVGDHHGAAFNTSDNGLGSYKFYNVNGPLKAGQREVNLQNASEASAFKPDQLIMIISSFKRQQLRRTLLPYHITICKITSIDKGTVKFEYPVDENLESVQIAANGGYDNFMGINYGGVYNVNIQNITIDASQITGRCYGYNCHLNNIYLVNSTRLIGANALAHTTITNISGTFSYRCIEIKTGSSDVIIKNIKANYKALSDTDKCRGVISLGEYNRNIIIDSFKIDLGNEGLSQPVITLQARKATVSNGVIYCKNQVNSFLKLFTDSYVSNPIFGCYKNKITNVEFYGSPLMKNILSIGDDRIKNKGKPDNGTNRNIPNSNTIENCLFSGGSNFSFAALNEGQQNIVKNCRFTKAKLKINDAFRQNNMVSNNSSQ